MSLNILQDHNLKIQVELFSKRRIFDADKDKIDAILPAFRIPLELNVILNLNIEDSLLHTGLRGTIEINNKFNIFDTLGVTSKCGDELFISIIIEDVSLASHDGIKEHETKIEFLGLVEKTQTASANLEDNIVIFEFEEYFVAEMKHTAWDTFTKYYIAKQGSDTKINVVELAEEFYKFALGPFEEGMNKTITLPLEKTTKDLLESNFMQKVQSATDDPEEKVHSVFQRILSRTSADVVNCLPSFRMNNTPEGRRMVFKKYISDKHKDFIHAVSQGLDYFNTEILGTKFSEVYTEKFTAGMFANLAGLADVNTNWHNKIETFNITRPDYGYLLENVWGNYYLPDMVDPDFNPDSDGPAPTKEKITDAAVMNNNILFYAQAVADFIEELDLNEASGVNLPLIDPRTQSKFIEYRLQSKDDEKDTDLRVTQVYNKLAKSFITVNEQLEFETKGQLYRKPGKFIWLEQDDSSERGILECLWYVNSITHNIRDGKYTTGIVANRVFGDNSLEAFKQLEKEAIPLLTLGKVSFRPQGERTPTLEESFETEDFVPNRIQRDDSVFDRLPQTNQQVPNLDGNIEKTEIQRIMEKTQEKAPNPPISLPNATATLAADITATGDEKNRLISGDYTVDQLKSFIRNAQLPEVNEANKAFKKDAEKALGNYVKRYGFQTKNYQEAIKETAPR